MVAICGLLRIDAPGRPEGAPLAGEESEPEDVDHVYTLPYLRDDDRPVRADWVPDGWPRRKLRHRWGTDRFGESPPAMRGGIGRPDALTS